MSEHSPGKRHLSGRFARSWLFPAACAAAVLLFVAAYSNSLRNAFQFDDAHVVVDNLHIRALENIPRFFTDARTFSSLETNAVYRPVVSTTLAVDYALGGGLDPATFHTTQLVLLALVGVSLFLLLLHLLRTTGSTGGWVHWAALFGATLFCVHTGNTQVGNYISARSESLAALGVLGAFLLYIHVPGSRRFHLYLGPVVFGALAKSPAVLFAPLFLVYRLLIEEQLAVRQIFGRSAWPRVRMVLVASAPAFILGIGLYLAIEWMNPPGQTYGGGGRWAYFVTQTWVWVRYFAVFFVPVGLTADTDLRLFSHWADPRVAAGVALLAATLAALWWTSRRRELRPVAFGIAWFWIGLVPSASIFPLAEVANDHRTFLPFIGLTVAVVTWASVLLRTSVATRARRQTLAAALSVLILAAHAVGTHQRNRVWRTDETLWADVVRKSPNNGRALMNYGLTQMRQGRLETARDYFLRGRELLPNYPFLEINLGIVYGALSDTAAAEGHFRRALALDPRLAPTHRLYGRWLIEQGRAPEAIAHLEQSIALAGGEVEGRRMLMEIYAARGDVERLRVLASQTLAVARSDSVAAAYAAGALPFGPPEPGAGGWLALGFSQTNQNRHTAAAQSYRAVLAIDSANADAWNNLGWSLGKLGFFQEAIHAFEAAVRHRPDYELARNNLAWARDEEPHSRFRAAFLHQQAGEHEQAIGLYRQLLLDFPEWANARYNLGYSLMARGDCLAAVPEFEAALRVQPSLPAAHLHLATCYGQLGRGEAATRHQEEYERASRAGAHAESASPGASLPPDR